MKTDIIRFTHLVDTLSTDNHLLFSFTHLLSITYPSWTIAFVKSPISEMFDDDDFPEPLFVLLVGVFELQHGINIPEIYLDYSLTIEEFIDKVITLPKMNRDEYKNHLDDVREIRYSYYKDISI